MSRYIFISKDIQNIINKYLLQKINVYGLINHYIYTNYIIVVYMSD